MIASIRKDNGLIALGDKPVLGLFWAFGYRPYRAQFTVCLFGHPFSWRIR